jgi:hypothetical protein
VVDTSIFDRESYESSEFSWLAHSKFTGLGWVIGLMGPIGRIAKDVLCCSFTIHYSLFTILNSLF